MTRPTAFPFRLIGVFTGLAWFALIGTAQEPVPKKANHLARESSPYLLQHAHNPVDWFPWSEEAFEKARKENKPVFLSIGYSACHWCHVMEKESFADEGVAKILNENFVCIKVDREMRPDIDQIYMMALAAQGTHGGWPLSMFLDPQARPIFGGTYWLREDRMIEGKTYSGFKSILGRVTTLWKTEKDGLLKQAERMAAETTRLLSGSVPGRAIIEPTADLVDKAVEALDSEFDPKYGGFGNPDRDFKGTKFPTPGSLLFWVEMIPRKPALGLAAKLERTLDHMGRGGIYDQLGGGFHRYSTERTWTVPHFEKMLYDNALLMEVYAKGGRLTRNLAHKRTVLGIYNFLSRDLSDPEGGFYSALDADSEGQEGRHYVWTDNEFKTVLLDKQERLTYLKAIGADREANFEGEYHIITMPRPVGELSRESGLAEPALYAFLDKIQAKLMARREKRPKPFLDKKILTGWNGLAIAGLATAGKSMEIPEATARAVKAAEFILAKMKDEKGALLRSWAAVPGEAPKARQSAFLEDYAYLIHGLLALHEATGEERWLAEAKKLADIMLEKFEDKTGGGFFIAAPAENKLFTQSKDQHDGALPSGNSMAAIDLVKLSTLPGGAKYKEAANRTLKAFTPTMKVSPGHMPVMATALVRSLPANPKP